MEKLIKKKIVEAEKRIKELLDKGDLKSLTEQEKHKIASFFESKCLNRLETARIIFKNSNQLDTYKDYSEAVSCSYYARYYIVHAFLAVHYKKKIRENVRGVHAVTQHIILYYLVKTGKLARHLYEKYVNTLKTTSEIQQFDIDKYQQQAFHYAQRYEKQREKREIFTYTTTTSAEEHHAAQALQTGEEFVNTIRQMMLGP